MRVALLSYRSKPHCGGQGVYLRHLSRELVALGHTVEVFSGQPYPELDEGVVLTKVPSLDLYREPDPFRTPKLSEYRDLIDVEEVLTMWTAGFPEPKTFSKRVARVLKDRIDEFDIAHDNQVIGYGMLDIEAMGLPLITTIHHPITFDRRVDIEAAATVVAHLERVPGDPRIAALMPFCVAGTATDAQATLFQSLWQDRVRTILIDHADDPEIIVVQH